MNVCQQETVNVALCNVSCGNWTAPSPSCSTGVHHESSGWEVQAAGSSGGSNAEGAEVSPSAEGRRQISQSLNALQAPSRWNVNYYFTPVTLSLSLSHKGALKYA